MRKLRIRLIHENLKHNLTRGVNKVVYVLGYQNLFKAE